MPPGHHVTRAFPVLSAGPTPQTPPPEGRLDPAGRRHLKSWTWPEFRAPPAETVTVDIHRVTALVQARYRVAGCIVTRC